MPGTNSGAGARRGSAKRATQSSPCYTGPIWLAAAVKSRMLPGAEARSTMRSGPGGASAGRAFAAVLVLLAAGCGHLPALHWPWHQRLAPAPAPLHELDLSAAAGDSSSF